MSDRYLVKRWQPQDGGRAAQPDGQKISPPCATLDRTSSRLVAKTILGTARSLNGVSAILSAIAPVSGYDPDLDLHSDDLAGFSDWVGYLSVKAVYPDRSDGIMKTPNRRHQPCEAQPGQTHRPDGKNNVTPN